MAFSRHAFLLASYLLSQCISVQGVPYIMIRNKAAKCFKLEHVKPQTMLKIAYHAPDLVLDDGTFNATNVTTSPEQLQENPAQDGRDFRYEERQKKRLDLMRTSRMKDVNIVVVQRYIDRARDPNDPNQQQQNSAQVRPPTKKIRLQLEEQRGEFYFQTSDEPSSLVEVCVQSYFASQTDPSRVALNITSSDDNAEIEEEGKRAMSPEEIQLIEQSNRVLKSQTSGITQELVSLEKKLRNIMLDIRHSARQIQDFQEQSLKLSKAVRYWPIFRVSVLLIGGYFQVSHVIGYMKRHHVF